MSRIVLLGATGFIGSNLLNELKKQNFKVKVIIHKKNLKTSSQNFSGNNLEILLNSNTKIQIPILNIN